MSRPVCLAGQRTADRDKPAPGVLAGATTIPPTGFVSFLTVTTVLPLEDLPYRSERG